MDNDDFQPESFWETMFWTLVCCSPVLVTMFYAFYHI